MHHCWTLYGVCVLLCCDAALLSPTTQNFNDVHRFQAALQQQTFQSILSSIEDRLKNLDNVYTLQLSQTLQDKLQQYNRKLDTLDSKIIHLESILMLNLDKISENISTKNYKDDITKTNIYKKIDSLYEGLNYKIGYVERKIETNFMKTQNKIEAAVTKLDKIDENLAQRDSDIDGELSDAIFMLEDLKTAVTNTERNLRNLTKISHDINKSVIEKNDEIKNILLNYTSNIASDHSKTTNETNVFLKSMKSELRDDLNEYANKVADMNVNIWKNNDMAENRFEILENALNDTKTKINNGFRAVISQVGKFSNENITIQQEENIFEDTNSKLLLENVEKILSNQVFFAQSCHRVQMNETQMESQIGMILNKLIDTFDININTAIKDVKSMEKTIKNHDSKMTRYFHQASANFYSFNKSTREHHQNFGMHIEEISNNLHSIVNLFKSKDDAYYKTHLTEKLSGNFNFTNYLIEINDNLTEKIHEISYDIQQNYKLNEEARFALNDVSKMLENYFKTHKGNVNLSSSTESIGNYLDANNNPPKRGNQSNKVKTVDNNIEKYLIDTEGELDGDSKSPTEEEVI